MVRNNFSKIALGAILLFFSAINAANAALYCNLEVIGGHARCNLTHDRGFGNFFHTTHDWASGPGGSVSPGFTLTGEATLFTCNCNSGGPVAVAVDYTLLILVENRDAGVLLCPNVNGPGYDV